MMDIAWIAKSVKEAKYFLSQHADKERMNDNLLIAQIYNKPNRYITYF